MISDYIIELISMWNTNKFDYLLPSDYHSKSKVLIGDGSWGNMVPSKVKDSSNTHSFNRYLWSIYSAPGTVWGSEDTAADKASSVPFLMLLTFQ